VGLPGYVDPAAATRFWTPLPQHAWGSLAAADLLTSELSTRAPLGWGPYVISQWLPGQRIELTRNSNYARAGEGLPHFSTLNFVFLGSDAAAGLNALADGTCDLLAPSVGLENLESTGMLGARLPADSWLHLDFSVRPQGFDDGFGVYVDRADYFGSAAMRQAFAQCIDRNELAAALNGAALAPSYVPAASPLLNAGAALPAYDRAAANAALDQLGWLAGADGVRINIAYPGALPNQRLELTLVTSAGSEETLAAGIIQSNLAACGVGININSLPATEAFATGPNGPIFGRNFDLALFAWPYGEQPACFLYTSEAIPGEGDDNRYGWGGWNVSGWQNAEFDAACQKAMSSLPGEPGYLEGHQRAQAIFAEQLPALPLVSPLEVVAARPDSCHFEPAAGEYLLQGLEQFGYGAWCQ
jgi:peptide/nickel transport system substrate-binding protein